MKNPTKISNDSWLGKPGTLLSLAKKCASQLNSPVLDEPLAQQIVKNLVYIGMAIYNLPHLCSKEDPSSLTENQVDSDDEDQNQDQDHNEDEQQHNEQQVKEKDEDETQKQPRNPVFWLFKRLSLMSRKEGVIKVS
jgi:ABC-type Zn2+ transport system substrate-binding protein/surface adhesin